MNYLLEETKRKAIKKYHSNDNDISLRTLEIVHVSETSFYAHILHNNMDRIVKNILEAINLAIPQRMQNLIISVVYLGKFISYE